MDKIWVETLERIENLEKKMESVYKMILNVADPLPDRETKPELESEQR